MKPLWSREGLEGPEESVIFLHLPKTAGTTLMAIMDRNYPPSAIHSLGADAHAAVAAFQALPAAERATIRLLRGHMGFGLHRYLQEPTTYFTLLRDPVERVISYYYYILRTPGHYLYDIVRRDNLDLKQLLDSGLALMMNDGQTRLISGVWGEMGYGEPDEAVLRSAQRNLADHFAVVGLTERFDDTLLLLQKRFGWRNVAYERRNVGLNRPAATDLPPETLTAVTQANQLDAALYAFGTRLFAAQVRQYGLTWRIRARPLAERMTALYWIARRYSVRVAFRRGVARLRGRSGQL